MPDWLTLAGALVARDGRLEAAGRLADAAGAESVQLMVRDPMLDVLLPAAGMPQTLRGGPRWRAFLDRCPRSGQWEDGVDLPPDRTCHAVALCEADAVLVLLGGSPTPDAMAGLRAVLPLLAGLLSAEQHAEAALAEARVAKAAAADAGALARALDSARADSMRLVTRLREEHNRKDEFLAMLAHELRNPLAPITMAAAVLRHPGARPETQRPLLDTITRQVGQMSRLIEDLLDVSRVSRGRIELRLARVDLREVARAAIETVEPMIAARSHELAVDMPEAPLLVQGDAARLTQVLSNLLNNAAKYTDGGGSIALSLRQHGTRAELEVADNGVGIPPALLDRVFDLFMQAPAALDRSHGGLGIGLTLVRKLVELHGGKVAAHSPGPGCGSTFRVTLPLAPARESEPPAGPSDGPGAGSTATLHILVVDDNRDAADTLAEMLRLRGHAVIAAYGAAEVLALLDGDVGRDRLDLILLDLGLPGTDGFTLAATLRARLPSVRLVALTGYGSEQDRARTRDTGFHEHQVKPLSESRLGEVLDRAAAARHQRQLAAAARA